GGGAGRDGKRIDQPAGCARELDDAEPGDARNLGDVGGERDDVTLLQCALHLLTPLPAAVPEKLAAVPAGTANGADAEPLRGERIDLAVAMPRDQHLDAVVGASDERHEKMLAMPHGDDDRGVAIDTLIDAFRLDYEPGGVPYQTKVFRRHDPGGFLERARAHQTLDPRHRAAQTSAAHAPIRLRIEQAVQMHDEVTHMRVINALLGLRLPGGIRGGVVGIDADDVQRAEIAKFDAIQVREFATEHKMQQLLSFLRHGLHPSPPSPRSRELGKPIANEVEQARVAGASGRHERAM